MQTPHESLVLASRQLNDQIRALDQALAAGAVPASSLEAMRREASEALALLNQVQGGGALVAGTIPKVAEHLDLFMDIAGSTGTDPALARKLLAHLLEEQLELTALAEREAGSVAGAPTPAAREAMEPVTLHETEPPAPAPPGGLLPGGRRPLTVGSLIDR